MSLPKKQFLRVDEAAAELSYTPRHIRRLISEGKLAHRIHTMGTRKTYRVLATAVATYFTDPNSINN